jgi:myo-inositol-1(or 4)-monophosphatase
MKSNPKGMTRFKRVAVDLARQSGAILRRGQARIRHIEYKGKIDLVTEMDKKVERQIARGLSRAFPTHDLLAEEQLQNVDSGADFRWIVDPLDGTTNYAHNLPLFSVSIGLQYKGAIVLGVVYQPVLDEMFVAVRGGGARLNGKPIAVTSERKLERSLLVTGFPYDMHTTRHDNLGHFRAFAKKAQAVRRLGSAALDLCYVACGRFEGYWELKLAPWDLAAGSLIASEAGARVTNTSGGRFSIYDGGLVASNGKIHRQMLTLLAGESRKQN